MKFETAMDKVLPILDNEYGGCCSFGFLGDNYHKAYHSSACHASLKNGSATKAVEYYYTTIDPKKDTARFEDMYDFTLWGLSDVSPWRSLVVGKDRAIVVKNNIVLGFILEVDPKVDAGLLRNMSMGLRLAGEHHKNFDAYLRFKALGLAEPDAFYLGNQFVSVSPTAAGPNSEYNTSHIIVPEPRDFHLKRFEEGNPYPTDEKLDGSGSHKWDGKASTKMFRQSKNVTGVKSLRETFKSGSKLKTRWTTANLGVSFETIAKEYVDNWKPEYISKLAA